MLYRQSKATLAIIILTLLTACYSGRRQQYLALLDQADSLNRAYAQMPPDSLMREAADFFDRHGSADERVRAHYLLGCAYRDLGQAPEALQAWHDALDRADTTRKDSSMLCLIAVYGQLFEMYHAQNLPEDELQALEKYLHYSLVIGDTMRYLRGYEMYSKPFFLMGDTIGMLKAIEKAREAYLSHGRVKEANSLYTTVIAIYLNQHKLKEAGELIDIFENQSGLFDSLGNISQGREGYYYFKGEYLLRTNQLTEAEGYFRKLPQYGLEHYSYKGLLDLYHQRGILDSVARYSRLYENAIDERNRLLRIDVVHRMSVLYNYQQFQIESEKNKLKASKAFPGLYLETSKRP